MPTLQEKRSKFRDRLKNADVENLTLPYAVVTGKSAAKVTKAAAVAELVRAMDFEAVDCQSEYLDKISPDQREALELYRQDGYVQMNEALRTGRMPTPLRMYHIAETLGKELTTTRSDAGKFDKAPAAFATALCKSRDAFGLLQKEVQRSLKESMRMWKHLDNLKACVLDAPPRSKDVVLWRGERFRSTFHAPKSGAKHLLKYSNDMRDLSAGARFTRKDFSSFSMSIVTACNFSGDRCCLYRCTLPKDAPALFMDTTSYPQEYEVVLPPGATFTVTGKRVVRSEVSPTDDFTVYELTAS